MATQFVSYPKVPGSASPGQQTMGGSNPVVIASDQSAVAVTAVSLPLPAGAATETTLAALSAKHPATLGQKAMAASLAVTLASDQSALAVTGTFWQATQPVSVVSLPLPTGAATETTLAAASAKLPASLGQKAMGASISVAIASDQGALAVTGTFWQATQPVSAAALPLPTGASTAANQSTANTSLASIDSKLPASGQAVMASSKPVVIASDQSALPIRTPNGALTDRSSSTSATPSTSTQVAASNTSRKYFFIENLDATNAIWINFGSAATAASGSIKIAAGTSFVMESGFISTDAVNVLAAVASIAFTAKEG